MKRGFIIQHSHSYSSIPPFTHRNKRNMLPRAKTAHSFRVLGSSSSSSTHQDAELEYSLIKGIVDAYAQRCTANTNTTLNNRDYNKNTNRIPLRAADKRIPFRVTEACLDFSSVPDVRKWDFKLPARAQTVTGVRSKNQRPMTSKSTTLPDSSKQEDVASSSNGDEEFAISPQTAKSCRSMLPHRNVFQRGHSARSIEKVLPVWTPDLKEGIVFTRRFQSNSPRSPTSPLGEQYNNSINNNTSSRNKKNKKNDISNSSIDHNAISKHPVAVHNGLTRSVSSCKVIHQRSHSSLSSPAHAKSPRPLATIHRPIRPNTVTGNGSVLRRANLKKILPASDDANAQLSNDLGGKSNSLLKLNKSQSSQDGSIETACDQHVLSLNVFLPRETLDSPLSHHVDQKPFLTNFRGSMESNPNKRDFIIDETAHVESPELSMRNYVIHPPLTGQEFPFRHENDSVSRLALCTRFQDALGKGLDHDDRTKVHCRKSIHCEVFGPDLCSDCRQRADRSRNSQMPWKPENNFSMMSLSLRGRTPLAILE